MANRVATWNPTAALATYLSLSAAEAAEQIIGANLVSLGDTLTFRASGDWSAAADTTAAVISGFTTGASNWILVDTDSANRYVGEAWDATIARLVVGALALTVQDNFVTILGLQLESTGAAAVCRCQNPNVLFDSCVFRGRFGVETNDAAASPLLRNCLFIDGSVEACRRGISLNTSGGTARAHNCTYAGTASSSTNPAFNASTGTTLTLVNCLGNDTTAGAVIIGGDGTIAQSYCATSDATASGTGAIASASFTFVNEAGGDYRIDPSDTSGAIGGGTDLSADANLPVVYDVSGVNLRPTTPTMGFWEANPAGGDIEIDVGMAEETDTAFGLALTKYVNVGMAEEEDSAFSLSLTTHVTPGMAEETDTALGLTLEKHVDVGMAVEVDTAFGLTIDGQEPEVPVDGGGTMDTDFVLGIGIGIGI